jgi:hypothetical protein
MFFTKDCFLFKKGKSYLFTPLKFRQIYSSLHGTVKGRLLFVAAVLRMRSSRVLGMTCTPLT